MRHAPNASITNASYLFTPLYPLPPTRHISRSDICSSLYCMLVTRAC